jgi:bifunctional non-homologous end joining protein LigD
LVGSGIKMDDIFSIIPEEGREKLIKMAQPVWVEPMLATLTKDYFSREGWIFERKFDGERCLAFKKGYQVQLYSRNRKSLNDNYPEIVEVIRGCSQYDLIVDGEVVAFEGGLTSFSRLQRRMQVRNPDEARRSGITVYYYLFDLLYLDGFDTTNLDLHYRKKLLRRSINFKDPLRFTIHRDTEGEAYHREACRRGWEGIIAKRATSKYVHKRSTDWLKFKCVNEQEFVVGGYTEPKGERVGFGALLVGYYQDNKLVYAGKVGTGYDDNTLIILGKRLSDIGQTSPPFTGKDIKERAVHWVRPEIVVQVGFTEWTQYGRLRHPRFLGIRRDKDSREVVKETA